jgi:hypothetical protein
VFVTDFVGIAELKAKQLAQLEMFRRWASESQWDAFHSHHYDWWAFPIDKPSSFGEKYILTPEAISSLRDDSEFIARLAESAQLLIKSWGWDWKTNKPVDHPSSEQGWANWPIRLSKCNRSLKIFGLTDLVKSSQAYARWLEEHGQSFDYSIDSKIVDLLPGILSDQL